jgi:hypothetical protein
MEDSSIQFIPDEIWDTIIKFLPIHYLIILSEVCRKLYEIAHESNYFKKQIIKSIKTSNTDTIKDYFNFSPLCCNGMKKFKYINKWPNIPIEFQPLYLKVLGFENIISNYMTRCNNIYALSISLYLNQTIMKFIEDNLPSNINKLTLIEDNDIEEIMIEFDSRKFTYVKTIKLHNMRLSNKSNFSNLINLELQHIFIELTEEIKEQLSNIKKLTLTLTSLLISSLTFLKNNEELSLNHILLSQELFESLSKNKKLKKLTLNTYADTNGLDLSIFGTSNLEYLTINHFGKFILNLNGLENIKYVNLSGVRVSNIHNTMCNKVLNLSNCNIKQHMIPKLLNIENLNISSNSKIRDTSIFSSEECNIKVLDLSYNEHIKYIDHLSNLEELSVIGCNDFIGILNILSRLKDTRLYIKPCHCHNCVSLYKYNIQKILIRTHTYNPKCLYEYKYDWFNF